MDQKSRPERATTIVAEHGGTISLESQIGMGTTVTVRVPLEVLTR